MKEQYEWWTKEFMESWKNLDWKMTRTMIKDNVKQNINGIFQVSLNEEGKCTLFKQWRYTR